MARIVLVADDSPTIQKRAMGILKGEGFEVETVSNGVAAIKRLGVIRPVAVLADVSMPGRDGYEVCDFVKKSPDLSQVPVLLVASDMEPYDSQRGAHVKADGVIKKPFEARELISVVVKFAEQFEAATISIADVSIAPPSRSEPENEFSMANPVEGEAPTVVQHLEPNFSQHAEGVAFAEPAGEEVHPFSFDIQPSEPEAAAFDASHAPGAAIPMSIFDMPAAQSEEKSLVAEAPLDPSPFAATLPHESDEVPAFMDHLTGAVPEPVFIDEHHGPEPAPSGSAAVLHTPIFTTPLETEPPEVTDDPAPHSSSLEAVELGSPAPQFITEDIAPQSEASHGHSHEHPHEHPHVHTSVGATSLDSFSLDDAAAGQVRFLSELPEVVYAAPSEEAAALEAAPPELTPEEGHAIEPGVGIEPEVSYAAPLPPEPEVVYAEPAAISTPLVENQTEAASLAVHAETPAGDEFPPEATLAGVTQFGHADEAVSAEAPPEPASAAIAHESVPDEPVHEPDKVEVAAEESSEESRLPVNAPLAALAGIASLGTAVEALRAGLAHHEQESHAVESEPAKLETVNETIHVTQAPEETTPETKPEPAAKVVTPDTTVDPDTLYTIVLKVVMKMAPPMLTEEAVEQIAKHLAHEISVELSLETAKPPAA